MKSSRLTFLSQISSAAPQLSGQFCSYSSSILLSLYSHTRNLPPVSGALRGSRLILLRPVLVTTPSGEVVESGGKVRKSSVMVQVARCSQRPVKWEAISASSQEQLSSPRLHSQDLHLSQNSISTLGNSLCCTFGGEKVLGSRIGSSAVELEGVGAG